MKDLQTMSDLFKLPHATVTPGSKDSGLPKSGDAIIVLRNDGSTGIFTFDIHGDVLVKKAAAGEPLTEQEQRDLDVTSRALTLYLVASNPAVMAALTAMNNDPDGLTAEFLNSQPKLC